MNLQGYTMKILDNTPKNERYYYEKTEKNRKEMILVVYENGKLKSISGLNKSLLNKRV